MNEKFVRAFVIILFILIFLLCVALLLAGLYYFTNTKEFLQYGISNPFYAAYTLDGTVDPTQTPRQLTLDGTNSTASQITCPVGYTAEIIKSTFNILDPFYTCTNGSEVNSFRIGCGDINYFINNNNKMPSGGKEGDGCQPVIISPFDPTSKITGQNQTNFAYTKYEDGNMYCLPTTYLGSQDGSCPTTIDYPGMVAETSTDDTNPVYNCVNSITCADLEFVNKDSSSSQSYKNQFPFNNLICSQSHCSPMRISSPFLAAACNGKQVCSNVPLDLTATPALNHGPFPCNEKVPVADCSQTFSELYNNCKISGKEEPYCKLPKVLGTNTIPTTQNCTTIDPDIKNILHGYSVGGLYRCIPNSTGFSISKTFKYLF